MKQRKYLIYTALYIVFFILFLGGLSSCFEHSNQGNSPLIFIKPAYLQLFWILPFLYATFYWNQLRKDRLAKQYGSPMFGMKGNPFISASAQFLFITSLSFIIIALSQPVYGKKKVHGISKSMEIAICLDVSNSMNVRDLQGESRLEVAKRTINGLISQLSGEKIGLCLFAGNAMVQLPLTSDYQTAQLFTSEVQTAYISEQGTNVVQALETGVLMFSKSNEPKCIVMITDGEDHENQQSEIYNYIREQQIAFYGIGIGTNNGGSIPEDPYQLNSSVKRNANGFTVISKLNPNYIKDLANRLNGTAIITSEAYPDLNAILTEINRAKSTKSRNLDFEIKASIYEYAVLIALISIVLWFIVKGIKTYE